MKKFWESLRLMIVSPEVLSLLGVGAIAYHWPEPFHFLGSKFASDEKLWEYIPVIPIGVLTFVVYLSFQLQAPIDSANRELYDWDLYWALKYRIIATLLWSGVSALFSLAIWFLSKNLPLTLVGCLFIGSLILSLVVAVNALLALFNLKEILAK
jgi:hypothetical protein